MIKIGELSNITEISNQTIRFYESEGLISPIEVDRWTNYRYYDESSIVRLSEIAYLKNLGFSLKEIRNLDENTIKEKISQVKLDIKKLTSNIEKLSSIRKYKGGFFMKNFVNDERVIGKWKKLAVVKNKEDFATNKLDDNDIFDYKQIYFLPNAEEYWVFSWTKDILFLKDRQLPYEIIDNKLFIDKVGYSLDLNDYYNSNNWSVDLDYGTHKQQNEEYIVYIKLNLKEIVYELQFFEDANKIVDINTATFSDYFASFDGHLNSVIEYPIAPEITGYSFVYWAYFKSNDITTSELIFLENGKTILNMPALEKSHTYYALKAESGVNRGKYILQLFPVYIANNYTIHYYDGDRLLATQNAEFNSEVNILEGNSALLNGVINGFDYSGFHVIGYELDYLNSVVADMEKHNNNYNSIIYNSNNSL